MRLPPRIACTTLLLTAQLLVGLAGLVGCAASEGSTRAAATPQRPTFSSATTTTAEGTFELEFGGEYDHHDSLGFPGTLKYGASVDTEVFLGGVPWQRASVSGSTDARGRGDASVGARHRFWEDPDQGLAAAWQFTAQLPTGSRTKGFSDDEYHLFAAGILDGTMGDWAWTAFYQYGSLGDPGDSDRQSQHGMSFGVSRPFDEHIGAYAELASIHTRARSDNPLQLYSGVTRSTDPSVVWDLGTRYGLNHDGGDVAITAGVTVNMGRLGRARSRVGAAP